MTPLSLDLNHSPTEIKANSFRYSYNLCNKLAILYPPILFHPILVPAVNDRDHPLKYYTSYFVMPL